MKKNNMMRLAAVLLILVLLSTSVISGTFAKYTTTASGNDTARAATWGFHTTTLSFDLFAISYGEDVSSTEKVVAPGTTKTTTITLIPNSQVNPEVAYSFNANVTAPGANADLLGKLVWYINDEICGTNGTFTELQDKINSMYDMDFGPGQLPTKTFTVKWEWPFDTDDTSDTSLGNGGAGVIIAFDFTATQKDEYTP